MVVTRRTRNAVARKGTWVRIPPSPPENKASSRDEANFIEKVGFEREE